MKTKKIILFYKITKDKVIPPILVTIERKDDWIKEIQREIEKKNNSRIVKVTYEIFNPEIKRILKFFNGPVIEYYVIQTTDMLKGRPERGLIDRYREELLDEVLGYDLPLVNRVVRRRRSTADFLDTQKWHDFLEMLRETQFEPNGYEFPSVDEFERIEEKLGYDGAHKAAIEELQKRLTNKLSPRKNDEGVL